MDPSRSGESARSSQPGSAMESAVSMRAGKSGRSATHSSVGPAPEIQIAAAPHSCASARAAEKPSISDAR